MSDKPSEEKTEDASARKLKKARERGEVPRSQVFAVACATIGGIAVVWLFSDKYGEYLTSFNNNLLHIDNFRLSHIAIITRDILITLSAPVILGALVASLMGNFFANRGLVFSMEKIKPKLQQLGFSSYRERTFSKRGLVNLAEIVSLMISLFVLLYLVALYFAKDLFKIFFCGPDCGINFLLFVGSVYVAISLFITLSLALVDIKAQENLYREQQRSTKTEAKQEQKEDMGEPLIRRERRDQHRQSVEGVTQEEKVNSTSFVIYFGDEAAVAIGYVKQDGLDRFYAVEGAVAEAAVRLKAAAVRYDKPLLGASQNLVTRLVHYGDLREILDADLIAALHRVISGQQR